jgi:hypothetical protein
MWNEGSRLCLQVPARNGVPHGNRVNIAFSAESRYAMLSRLPLGYKYMFQSYVSCSA